MNAAPAHRADLPAAYAPVSAASEDLAFPAERIDAIHAACFGEGDFNDAPEAIDRFPAWLAGGIVVALSGVFWVGLLTIADWII